MIKEDAASPHRIPAELRHDARRAVRLQLRREPRGAVARVRVALGEAGEVANQARASRGRRDAVDVGVAAVVARDDQGRVGARRL